MYLDDIIAANKKSIADIYSLRKEVLKLKKRIACYENKTKKRKHTLNGMSLSITALEEYKELCAKDIPVLANAISDLYNLINFTFDGKLLEDKDTEESDEDLTHVTDLAGYFDEADEADQKKNKKIYH
jgi:hypothetical protein